MGGNVWEWVVDWYGEDYYAQSPDRDPQGPDAGISRVLRGGSMSSDPYRLRTTDRSGLPPSVSYVIIGFRCAARELPHYGGAVRKLGTDQAQGRGGQRAVNPHKCKQPLSLCKLRGCLLFIIVVAPRGIEPRTQRFSVSCSTY